MKTKEFATTIFLNFHIKLLLFLLLHRVQMVIKVKSVKLDVQIVAKIMQYAKGMYMYDNVHKTNMKH